ncbi:hypothetical protein HZS_4828 [Henneguya salminicola]|nr:hypothetical protein HZS_4828 [Henneguya salminicola]
MAGGIICLPRLKEVFLVKNFIKLFETNNLKFTIFFINFFLTSVQLKSILKVFSKGLKIFIRHIFHEITNSNIRKIFINRI